MAGLILQIFFTLFPFITLHNGLKMSEYEVYWLTCFPLINDCACQEKYGNLFKKQTNKCYLQM